MPLWPWTTAADAERVLARTQPQLERAVTAHAEEQAYEAELAEITARRDHGYPQLDTLTPRLRHAEARVQQDAAAIRDQLRSEWDADRPVAAQAARTVLAGPGWLRLHRRDVTHATQYLQDWAAKWEPVTGDLTTRPGGVVAYAQDSVFVHPFEAALDRYAHIQAEAAHPERGALATALDTAREQARSAHRDERDAQHAHNYSGGGRGWRDWERQIPTLERQIATAQERLRQAERRTAQLEHDPAILTQPAWYLHAARTHWNADHAAAPATVRPRPARYPRPHPPRIPQPCIQTGTRPGPRRRPLSHPRPVW